MNDGDGPSRYRSMVEVETSIVGFADEDWRKLTACAASLARSAPWTCAADLMQSALTSALGGDRKCPVDVPVLKFLCNAMRGILFNARKGRNLEENAISEISKRSDHEEADFQSLHEQVDEITKAIAAEFKGDEGALVIFEGRIEGMARAEIRELLGMGQTEYESLERRIRRFAAKYSRNGSIR